MPLGDDLSMNSVKQFMQKVWNFVSLPELYCNDEGYSIVRFRFKDDLDRVQMQGPYTIYGVPMFLKEWFPYFELKEDFLRILPIWIQLPQ